MAAHPEIEVEYRLRDEEREQVLASAPRTTPAGLARAAIRGGGTATEQEGVVTVTPGPRLVFAEADLETAPSPAPAPATAARTRAREAHGRRVRRDRSPPSGDDSPSGRPEPRLVVELPLEGQPTVRLLADSAEDELRLLDWLLRARELRHLGLTVFGSLDVYVKGQAR